MFDDSVKACMCGLSSPSRPHLLWNCDATADLRVSLAAPTNRLEQRMLGKTRRDLPPVVPVVDWPNVLEETEEALRRAFSAAPDVFVATDGSASHNTSAFAIVFPGLDVAVSAGVPSEDQSAFRAEVQAIELTVDAALQALQHACGSFSLTIVSDCQAAIGLAKGQCGDVPILAKRIHEKMTALAVLAAVRFIWIPSHGKQNKSFQGHAMEPRLRAWNAWADREAGACMRRRLSGSPRERWHAEQQAAHSWELSAVKVLQAVAERYHAFADAAKQPALRM